MSYFARLFRPRENMKTELIIQGKRQMRYINSFKRLAMLAAIMAMIGLSIGQASARVDHHVQVRNNSNKKIIKILASTDGENYAGFNIENGLKPGQMVEISWNKSNGQ